MIRTTIGSVLAIAILTFYACKKDENFSSRITFFNGVINASSPFTLKSDSLAIAQNTAYDSLKANVVTPSGTVTLSLLNNNVSLLHLTTNLQANESYTAVVYDSAQRFQFFMRTDVYPSTPGFGRCAVRIYNLIPGSASLFLGRFIDTAKNKRDTAKAYITGKTFNDFASGATSPAFTEIDTITRPKIYTADTIPLTPLLPPLLPGKIYTFYLTGSIKDSVRLHPKCIIQVHN